MTNELLMLQRTVGNATTAALVVGRHPVRSAIQRQVIQRDQRNSIAALRRLRLEQLFGLYLGGEDHVQIDGTSYEGTWIHGGAGTQAIRNVIRQKLDQKTADELEYFVRRANSLAGNEERKRWLRDAAGFRLRQRERRDASVAAEALESITAFVPTRALGPLYDVVVQEALRRGGPFVAGVWAGVKRQIHEDELAELGGKLALGVGLSMIANPAFMVGVSAGILEDFYESGRGLFDIALIMLDEQKRAQFFNQIAGLITDLLSPETGGQVAYGIGLDLGRGAAHRIEQTLRSDWWQLPFQIGRLVGPLVFQIVLGVVGGEGVVLAGVAARLVPVVRQFPRLAQVVRWVRESVPEAPHARRADPTSSRTNRTPDGPGQPTGSRGSPANRDPNSTLTRTADKAGWELTPEEMDDELRIVANSPRRSSRDGYVQEVELSNGHVWKQSRDGGWCRHSDGVICVRVSEEELRILQQGTRGLASLDSFVRGVHSIVERVGLRAAADAANDLDFVNLLRQGRWTEAGGAFHRKAQRACASLYPPGSSTNGFQVLAEHTAQSGAGGSRLDLFIQGPDGRLADIDWKTTIPGGLQRGIIRDLPPEGESVAEGAVGEMARHQAAISARYGRSLTLQEARPWLPLVFDRLDDATRDQIASRVPGYDWFRIRGASGPSAP